MRWVSRLNYLIKKTHVTKNLLLFTAILSEEENWNDGDAVWEEFATIATDLLERINAHLESV